MASVQLVGLCKTFSSGATAVRDVSIDVADGEFVVIAGPSGCGKSTTLRMIAGLETPTAGHVVIAGQRANDVPPDKRDVAMVFQSDALYPHLTVRGNLAFGLKARGISANEVAERVRAASVLLGLNALMERMPSQLSGGERQRVALGRAIIRRPRVFLLDEPLTHLDAGLRSAMRTQIAALHRNNGGTMLYVTHDQVEAMTLADRLVVMREGAVQQVGPPMELYLRPANRFVATFLGSPSMNLFQGCVEHGNFCVAGDRAMRIQAPGVPDGPAVLGVRPEDLLVGDSDTAGDSLGPAQLVSIERLGHECLLYIQLGPAACVARSARAPVPDQALFVRPGMTHYFSADENGERIDQVGQASPAV